MGVYVDPETGERFDNDAPDADASAAQVGLVPLAQFEADSRPFLESAGEAVQAVGNTLLRPLEAAGKALPRSRMAESNERLAGTWSPSSDDSRRIAQEHPIASALPLAGELLLPGGALVQGAAGALGSAAEATFQGGGEYGEIDPNELLTAAALGGGLAAAAPVARGVAGAARGAVGLARAGTHKLSDLGAGALGKAMASPVGRNLTEDVVREGVETAFKGVGAVTGTAMGGPMGGAAGWVAGRQLNKRYGDRLVDAIYGAAKGSDNAGLGVAQRAASAPPIPQPINPESVAVGTGLGPIFQRAEQAMSPAMQRAKQLVDQRRSQSGAVGLGKRLDPGKVKSIQSEGSAIASQMTEDEIDAVRSFTSRHGDRVGTPEWDSAVAKLTVKNPTDAGPLFRGTRMQQKDIDDLLREGSWTNREPTSLSFNRDLSDAFAHGREGRGQKVLFQIEDLDEGVNFMPREVGIGRSGLEREINLAKPTTLRVLGSAVDGEGTTVIRLGSRGGESGHVALGSGPNFSLGDVAKSPMGVVTGLAGAGMVGNVLARAERRANESIDFDDLEDLSDADRRAALQSNGKRYQEQSTKSAITALEGKTGAYLAAKDSAMGRIGHLVAKPSDAQRAYADMALGAIEQAEQALRAAGDTEGADQLIDAADELTEAAVAHQQKLPVSHDAGDLLATLNRAYGVLRAKGPQLPPEAGAALQDLEQGTVRPELWGQGADLLADLREADDAADAVDILDTSDPESWRRNLSEHLNGARQQADVLEKWGVDTEKLTEQLDDLERAVARGDAVASELAAAGVIGSDGGSDPWDLGPGGEMLGAVAAEAGAGNVDDILEPGLRQALDEQQKAFRYESALRSVQRGADVALRKAARGMVGYGLSDEKVEPDASNVAFSAGYSDELAAFEARRTMIQKLATDPMALADSMASSYGDLVRTHPEVYDQLSTMVVRATDVLTEAMPPSMLASFQNPRGLPPSVDDVRSFSRVFMAVTEPELFLKELGAGQAWPEQAQAFSRMYPEKWQVLAQEATLAAQQKGPELSPQSATYLDLTFNIGNTIGGIWSDAGAAAIRDANVARAEAAQEKSQSLGQPSPAAAGPQSATAALSGGPSRAE